MVSPCANTNQFDGLFDININSKKRLRIIHVNVEDITVHRETFLELFSSYVFDIIVVSETFLKPAIANLPYLIDGYNLIRHDRENKEGGGLAVYIRTVFRYKIITKSQAIYCMKPEFILLEISFGWKLLLGAVYRPPKLGFISEFFDSVANLLPMYNHVLLIGDFNVDLSSSRVYADKTQLLELVDSLNLSILPLDPTYHRLNSDTLLDLMIVNDVSRVTQFGQLVVSGLSYHDLVYVELNLKNRLLENNDKITVRDFKNINTDQLKQECLSINWDELYLSNSIDEKVDYFVEKLIYLLNKYAPERRIKKRRNACPWVNEEIKKIMRERDSLYKQYIRTKDVNIWENYRALRNRIKRIIRDSRNNYFAAMFQSVKSNKEVWNVVKSQGAGKEPKKINDPVVPLNSLNDFFCGINNDINYDLIHMYKNIGSNLLNNSFNFKAINHDLIYRAIMDISSNAVGNDGIPLKFIRLLFDETKEVLCHIFNFSLFNSVYPKQWKQALIIPLPKVTDPIENKHYRSINILCVLGKVLDKLVYNQMCSFIDDNNILNKYQSGYRRSYSTQTALIRVTDDIRYAIDNRKITILLLLDFTRAFDCVHHRLLLAIMESCNFSSDSVKWFQSYLEHRTQRVKTRSGQFSDWKVNPAGVPQGSTLSALLFSLYLNRISENLMFSNIMLYADDAQLYIHCDVKDINNAVNSLNADVELLYNWCNDHGLILNTAKCKPIIIGNQRLLTTINRNVLPVLINGQEVPYEQSIVNLGLRINTTLTWSEQVNYIHKKVFQCLYQFRKLCFSPPMDVKKLLISTLVFPFFDYASLAFCDLNETLTNKLQRAQNACIRYIFNLRLDDHVTEYYKRLGWLKIRERREYNLLSMTFRMFKNKKPDYLYEKYIRMSDVHNRQTRFGNTILQFPIHRTLTYSKSFHVLSIRLMNMLDDNIKNVTSDRSFCKKLKEELLKRYN